MSFDGVFTHAMVDELRMGLKKWPRIKSTTTLQE